MLEEGILHPRNSFWSWNFMQSGETGEFITILYMIKKKKFLKKKNYIVHVCSLPRSYIWKFLLEKYFESSTFSVFKWCKKFNMHYFVLETYELEGTLIHSWKTIWVGEGVIEYRTVAKRMVAKQRVYWTYGHKYLLYKIYN